MCMTVLVNGEERNELKRDHEIIKDDNEPFPKKHAKEARNDIELESNEVVKDVLNDDINSEVSNPNVSPRDNAPSLQTISSQKLDSGTNKLVVSDEESLSEEEMSKNINLSAPHTSSFVLEIPEHINSCGIKKITFKFSKFKDDYENKSSVTVVRSVSDRAFESSHNVSDAKYVEREIFRDVVEGGYDSIPYQRSRETEKLKKLYHESYLTNVKKLLSSGILEGAHVKYVTTSKRELPGIVRDWGYMCGCSSCNFSRILSAYEFEMHAGGSTKHPNNHIFLENGRPIYTIIQELKTAPLSMVDEVIRSVAGSAVNEEMFQAWRARIQQNTGRMIAKKSEERKWMAEIKKPFHPQKMKSAGCTRRRDNDLHRVLFMPNGLPDGAELAYYSKGQRILGGYKQGNGIVCSCCHTEISPSQFEAHAGWSVRRQPYRNIYTCSGLTLHDLALSLASGQQVATGSSDDMCAVCGDGGDLIICDGCPRSFHAVCLDLECAPNGDWYCPFCQDRAGLAQKTAGVPSYMGKPIKIRRTRVVKAPEIETGGCVFCRANDFSAAKFDDRTVMLCDQCEREYHVGCLRERGLADLKELPKEKWFCGDDCMKIHTGLQNKVLGGAEMIPTAALKVKNKKHLGGGFSEGAAYDVRWQILSGKSRVPEHLPILSSATAIFRECFDPIVASSGRDLIPVMVYGRNISGQEFGGMYCVVLIVNSVVVSAGLLRIFGRDAAELPLVATSREHQGKGYFQVLFSCIEGLLYSLNVENEVLPAAEEAESIWTKKLGFRKMSNERLVKYTQDFQLTSFKGTSMLEKQVQLSSDDFHLRKIS